jgi:hypothetical protein
VAISRKKIVWARTRTIKSAGFLLKNTNADPCFMGDNTLVYESLRSGIFMQILQQNFRASVGWTVRFI